MCQVEVKNVSVHYGNVCALNGVNLKIKKGDFLGIIGPNGGGKTTLLKVILGLTKPSSGKVIKKNGTTISYVPQFSSFSRGFPIKVLDVILMGRLKKGINFFHRYSKEDIEKADYIMEKLQISKFRDRQIGQLSGGQLQKVLIARALAVEPNILLLDEPTASLDTNSKTEIYQLLKSINKDVTVVLVSHDIGTISSYVKSIACINQSLFYHGKTELSRESIEKTYGCPIDLVAHGFPHRVLRKHEENGND
ncbi:metal ABC transporter ATP-binding protein [Thermohalobacter berrensis]|uniref:ABC transporter n=1 Tax=Thermohalobacter berrensis TaxID=99594 RepID=A0A419SWH7_9FIRM|nr:metal ABC transporter ATP-binding protein [Thermohalobacter berrensis]RKD29559.1 ABC transporter [Thermohalobacter berrensis]